MWSNVYPKLVGRILGLINDIDPSISNLALIINSLLKDIVEYVLEDKKYIFELFKVLMPHFKDALDLDSVSETMDWIILLLKKQPQSLTETTDDILNITVNLLPEVGNEVGFK